MLILSAARIHELVAMRGVIDCLRIAFRDEYAVPVRQAVPVPGASGNRLCLIMSAFDRGGGGVVKVSTVFPENPAKGLPAIQGALVVFSDTGELVAVLDGRAITHLRTAAASALASTFLSRVDSTSLLIVGTGDLAPSMALAHCTVRPIKRVCIWGRRPEAADATADAIRARVNRDIEVITAEILEPAAACADIVSLATASDSPLLLGRWLKPGTFVDVVGSFSPNKREVDDDVVLRSRVFVDTYDGALKEAGDLLDPMYRGIITQEHIVGELRDLVTNRVEGRKSYSEITLFKSVGTAIEDLALAHLVVDKAAACGFASSNANLFHNVEDLLRN